jgi:hypothetical protein
MSEPIAPQKFSPILEFLKGMGLVIALYFVIYAGLWVALYTADLVAYVLTGVPNGNFTQGLYPLWLFGIVAFGLVQWLYLLPVAWWLQGEGKGLRVRGLVAVAVVTSVLNGLAFWQPGLFLRF